MNTFNKKSLYTAIAGLSALGVTDIAQAVHVNPEGLGQVLIYPYYTARARDILATTLYRARRTTRCCRSSTRPPRRRPSRSASWKA